VGVRKRALASFDGVGQGRRAVSESAKLILQLVIVDRVASVRVSPRNACHLCILDKPLLALLVAAAARSVYGVIKNCFLQQLFDVCRGTSRN